MSRTAMLKATFEGGKFPDVAYGQYLNIEIPDDFVPTKTKYWNKAIGSWIFLGIQKPQSPQMDRMRRPSNEIRLPTPLSTPVYGSTDNLIEGGSRTSLLSSNFDDIEEEPLPWDPTAKFKLGEFVHEKKSTLATATTHKIPIEKEDSKPPSAGSIPAKQVDSETEKAGVTGRLKWKEALRKYEAVKKQKVKTDLPSPHGDSQQQDAQELKQSAEEPTYSSVVEQRAKLFGGTRPLRRAKTFHVGPRDSPKMNQRRTMPSKVLSTSFL